MKTSSILSWFYVQTGTKGQLVRIEVDKIIYLESAKNYLHFIMETGKVMTYLTLSEMQSKLPAHFMRVHKAFIINLEKIAGVNGNVILTSNGDRIPVGPTYRKVFMRRLEQRTIRSYRQTLETASLNEYNILQYPLHENKEVTGRSSSSLPDAGFLTGGPAL